MLRLSFVQAARPATQTLGRMTIVSSASPMAACGSLAGSLHWLAPLSVTLLAAA
jgi:hypothetical protein